MNGDSEKILLNVVITLPLLRALYFSEKMCCCISLHIKCNAEEISSCEIIKIDGFGHALKVLRQ